MDTNRVHQGGAADFARETGDLTVHRWKIGVTLYLLFAAVGLVAEWQEYPSRAVPLLVAYGLQMVVLGLGFRRMRQGPSHPESAGVVLACNVGIVLILALYNGVVGGDMLYLLLTFVAINCVTALFIPWGAEFQLALGVGVIVAHSIGVLSGGHIGPVPEYDYVISFATLVFATLGASYIEQYRARLFAQARDLQAINDQLRLANQTRMDMINGLAHDMRTPLGVIIGYADILGEFTNLPGDVLRPIRSVQREARELLSLLDGVLDLARLEAGRMPVHSCRFGLREALEPLRLTMEDLLAGGRVQLRWDVPPELMVDSDAGKVCAIVRNLLSNAVKHTPKGEIQLVANQLDGCVEFTVSDTGVGIPPEHADLIFEAFRQTRAPGEHHLPGLGFGLYMVKLLVRLIGGTIDLRSEPGRGSQFRVHLPVNAMRGQA